MLRKTVSMNYDDSCPSLSQWTLRASKICTINGYYHCLQDKIDGGIKELCRSPLEYTRGRKAVYSGNLDAQICSSSRYMPYIFVSNMSDECLYQKSNCNEDGQIEYENRSPTDDNSCLCDFTNGYVFVTTPKNKCYCVPSEEDCSCIRICRDANKIVSSDYACIDKTQPLYGTQCPVVITQNHQPFVVKESNMCEANVTNPSQLKCWQTAPMVVAVIVISMLLLFSGFILVHNMESSRELEPAIPVTPPDKRSTHYKSSSASVALISQDTSVDIIYRRPQQDDQSHVYKLNAHSSVKDDICSEKKPTWEDYVRLNVKLASKKRFRIGTELCKRSKNEEPRILDMCFVEDGKDIFLIFIDANNNCIVKWSITDDVLLGCLSDFPEGCTVNRLAKINNTFIAVIFKKQFSIRIYDVTGDNISHYKAAAVNDDVVEYKKYGIQGIVSLKDPGVPTPIHFEFMLSNKSVLYSYIMREPKTQNEIAAIQNAGTHLESARRFAVSQDKQCVFIADEDDKKITSMLPDGTKIHDTQSHNRGLQNVRAIAVTERKLYAATSAGISVYTFNDQYMFFDKNYKMLLEYYLHVEHTRCLCVEKKDKHIYIGVSFVIQQKDAIAVFSFDATKDFC